MKELIVASSNLGKIKEIQAALWDIDVTVTSLADVFGEEMEIEETGTTFKENALLKAKTISERIKKPVLADDSGLEVEAMDNQPGVYSARFLGKDTSYEIKNQHIIEAVEGKTRVARFVCAMALIIPEEDDILIQETMEGEISPIPKGEHGFGYDPIFFYPPCQKTLAQMTMKEKNQYSHRGKALRSLKEKIKEITR